MVVRYAPPDSQDIFPVAGVRLGITQAGIRKLGRDDLCLLSLDPGTAVGAVFTQNRFCAAPVLVCREHLALTQHIRGLVINTGNANAGTGEAGLQHARTMAAQAAQLLGCLPQEVLPFSTGVIMEPLPVSRVVEGLPACLAHLDENHWLAAAKAIMTTDTVAKVASRRVMIRGVPVTVTGIAKGAGMIHPNMATMLAFIATDAPISAPLLQHLTEEITQASFNRITIDGDTSTNDSFVLIATGKADVSPVTQVSDEHYAALRDSIREVAVTLAQAIVRDGEGATKFITVQVEQGRTEQECDEIARAIAHSPLVKTALYASDPNLGRILAAIGYAGVQDLEVSRIDLYLNDLLVAEKGGRAASYTEASGQLAVRPDEITIRVVLHRGLAQATVWTCDFSEDYVRINAEYRT